MWFATIVLKPTEYYLYHINKSPQRKTTQLRKYINGKQSQRYYFLVQLLYYQGIVHKMDDTVSTKLRSNHVELMRNLNPEDVTDYLYQERVLTQEDAERIVDGPTRAQKARIFVGILQLKPENALVKFLEALREGGNEELAAKVEKPITAADIEAAQSSESTELEELKEALKEQSEMVQAITKEWNRYLTCLFAPTAEKTRGTHSSKTAKTMSF